MSRYKVCSKWDESQIVGKFTIEFADILDTETGRTHKEGAYRITVDGKPAFNGKGGSRPFFGETAWMDAERLAFDLEVADRIRNRH